MKSFLIAIGMSLLLVSSSMAAGAPPFPYTRYADVPVSGPMQQVCNNGGQLGLIALGQEWRVLSWKDRDLFIHFDAEGKADWVYLTVDKGDGTIRILRVLPASEARALYPSGCEYGDERSA